jgi:hypothetical protein
LISAPTASVSAPPLISAPPAVPARPGRRRALLLGVVTALAFLAVAGAAGMLVLANMREEGGNGRQPGPSPSTTPASTFPAATEEYANAGLGFKLRIPAVWSFRCLPDGETCRFNALTGPDRLDDAKVNRTNNLYVTVKPANGKDPLTLAQEEDRQWKSRADFKDYRTVRLRTASFGQHQEGSVLEFTYLNQLTGPRHVLIFRTVANDQSYEVSLNAPAATFDEGRPVFDDAVDTFEITAS